MHTPALNWWRPETAAATAARPTEAGRGAFVALVVFTAVLIAAPQEFFGALRPFRLALVAAYNASRLVVSCLLSVVR